MVKRDVKSSISEDDGDSSILNHNGKRPSGDAPNSDGIKRLKTKSLYRQPTVRELNRLQETETLFNSNLFRLQVEEILEEVKLKEKIAAKFQQWFESFKKHMNAIPVKDKEYDLSENTIFKELKVKSPLGSNLKKTKCVFRFHKFSDINLIGSYALECSINSKLRVDLEITVPAETYTKNDSLNYRYHKKRAAYLAYIASHLKQFEAIKDLHYSWLDGCESKPGLDFIPNGKLGNHLSVRIHLSCESGAYKPHRLSPTRNNLRESWLFGTEASENNTEFGSPTPYYNSSILQDLTASVNHEFLKEVLFRSDNLKQAIMLLKIWLRQRNLRVLGHVVSMLVAHLMQTKRINNIMSSYQIVRNVWISLKSSEWDTKGISLHKGNDPTPPLEDFLQAYPVVFMDRTGHYNMTWQMSTGTYQALKRESSLAVDMLDNGSINSFIPLFMTPVTPLLQFDHILRFKDVQNVKSSVYNAATKDAKLNYGTDRLALVSDAIQRLLTKGLGERVELILPQMENDFSWPVKEAVEKAKKTRKYEENLSFGLILNPEHALNIVEKGPAANLPEAEQFRAFWGDKSELRRFQDGAITETCVWSADSLAERRMLTKQIVSYLLHLKFGISSEVFYIGDQLDSVLIRKQLVPQSGLMGTGEEDSLSVIQAFDELRRDLRALTEVPLDVSSVYGTSPVFSYTAPLPPAPAPPPPRPRLRHHAALVKEFTRQDGLLACPAYTPANVAVVELSYSGKWPGDLQAFRCLKAAFHLQLAERITKQYSLPAQAYPGFVDVLKNGYVFRLVIAHPKEITLVKREVDDGVVRYKESDESSSLERDTVLLPRLRGALHGLHQKHPAYGPAVCLLKRWLSGHLLDGHHFPEPVAELLVAHSLLRAAAPLAPPASPLAAFLRVLRLLATTDWATEMVIVDFNDDIPREQQAEFERAFASRDPAASPALHIVTSHDSGAPGTTWTSSAPTKQVLARVKALATSTLDHVNNSLWHAADDNVMGIFVPSLSGYDVIIRLHPSLVPHSGERVQVSARPARAHAHVAADVIPVTEFSAVREYLGELRSAYSDFALFFHDTYGGDVIAVLWKPNVAELNDFQVSTINATKRIKVNGEVKYATNIEAIVADFRALGADLVMDITVNS